MFFEPEQFPFTADLETHWKEVFEEFTKIPPEELVRWPERNLCRKGWTVFGLYALGSKIDDNCRQCPKTTALVEQVPGLTSAGFSVLAPQTRIKSHCGYTSSVLRCHLGLSIPPECGLQVGDEIRTWTAGKCIVFDDTVRHSAWNKSGETRIVFLLDFAKGGQAVEPVATKEAHDLAGQLLGRRSN